MKSFVASVGVAISLCSFATADMFSDLTAIHIVPEILSQAPKELLSVIYKYSNGKVKGLEFIGEELTPTLVKDPPALKWISEDDVYYTVIMIDPDSPSRADPQLREMLHWLVVNIPGDDVSKGDEIVEYVGSAPDQGTDLHRYVLLIYRQPDKLTLDEPRISRHRRNGRSGYNVVDFAAKYKLGQPLACNVFLAQYDNYVPIVQKQMMDDQI